MTVSPAEFLQRQNGLRRELIDALTTITGGGDVTGVSDEAIALAQRIPFEILDQRYLEITDPGVRGLHLKVAEALLELLKAEVSDAS